MIPETTSPRRFPRPLLYLSVAAAILLLGAFGARRLPAALFATDALVPVAAVDSLGALPADQWLNTPTPMTSAGLRGDVVLVEFWTYLCYNCHNVEPWVLATQAKYAPAGLQVIGIHTPEFAEERDVGNVRRYLERHRITWPVAIDNDYRVWTRYNSTNAWPAFLVFDRRGRLLFQAAGENAVGPTEAVIRQALADTTGQRPPTGVRVGVTRVGDSLRVALTALPGYKLVESPANEVWLGGDTTAPAGRIGAPFDPTATEVRYFKGPALGMIPLPRPTAAGAPIAGRIVYRYCSEGDRVCLRRESAFTL